MKYQKSPETTRMNKNYHLLRSIWWFVPLGVTFLVVRIAFSETINTCGNIPFLDPGECPGPWLFILVYPVAKLLWIASVLIAAVGVIVISVKLVKKFRQQ